MGGCDEGKSFIAVASATTDSANYKPPNTADLAGGKELKGDKMNSARPKVAAHESDDMNPKFSVPARGGPNNGGKQATLRRLSPEEFQRLLEAANLSPEEFAMIWNADPRRVHSWLPGGSAAGDIPFPIAWALALLQRPSAFDDMMAVFNQRASFKPEFVNRRKIHANIEGVVSSIEERLPEAERVASVWETEHPGERHANRDLIDAYRSVRNSKGIMNIARQLKALQDIAGKLGVGIDVNEQILKDNAPFIDQVDADRRARSAKQRAAAPELPAYRKK